jgi:hypothetical protein
MCRVACAAPGRLARGRVIMLATSNGSAAFSNLHEPQPVLMAPFAPAAEVVGSPFSTE